MTAQILDFHQSNKVASYLRVGHTGHKQLEDLHACGDFKFERVVIEAPNAAQQMELMNTLRHSGSDLILDTRASEFAHEARLSGNVRKLPWAPPGRVCFPEDYNNQRDRAEFVNKIAEFAIDKGFSSIISPAHPLSDLKNPWLELDIELCNSLRETLNRLGGEDISIEYPLILTAALLNDSAYRKLLVARLSNAVFDNLWLKVSGFGHIATAAGLRKYIDSTMDLRQMGKALIADCAGGLPGLALLAFDATGGIAHGINQKESFNIGSWTQSNGKFRGRKTYFYLSALDMYVDRTQLDKLLKARGAKSLLITWRGKHRHDGNNDMMQSPSEYFLNQRFHQIEALNATPQLKRSHYFIDKLLRPAIQNSRKLSNSKILDGALNKKIVNHIHRLEKIERALSELNDTNQATQAALIPNRCKIDSLHRERKETTS